MPHAVISRFAAPDGTSGALEPHPGDRLGDRLGARLGDRLGDGTGDVPTTMSVPMSTARAGQGMMAPAPNASTALATASGRRGWLGVALQPITVPDQLVQKAGQTSGRMVVSVSAAGPADRAGLRVGDVLLALDGYSTSGSHALRAFLGADRIGRQVEVRLLRDGSILSTFLTVAAQPAGQSNGSGGGSR